MLDAAGESWCIYRKEIHLAIASSIPNLGPTLSLALVTFLVAGTQADAQTPAPKTIRAHFACSGGKTIEAAFVNGVRSSVKLVLSDGRTLTLPQARSGSGARYANKDESVVFWNKGDTAFMEEAGKTTYEGCVAKSL